MATSVNAHTHKARYYFVNIDGHMWKWQLPSSNGDYAESGFSHSQTQIAAQIPGIDTSTSGLASA